MLLAKNLLWIGTGDGYIYIYSILIDKTINSINNNHIKMQINKTSSLRTERTVKNKKLTKNRRSLKYTQRLRNESSSDDASESLTKRNSSNNSSKSKEKIDTAQSEALNEYFKNLKEKGINDETIESYLRSLDYEYNKNKNDENNYDSLANSQKLKKLVQSKPDLYQIAFDLDSVKNNKDSKSPSKSDLSASNESSLKDTSFVTCQEQVAAKSLIKEKCWSSSSVILARIKLKLDELTKEENSDEDVFENDTSDEDSDSKSVANADEKPLRIKSSSDSFVCHAPREDLRFELISKAKVCDKPIKCLLLYR